MNTHFWLFLGRMKNEWDRLKFVGFKALHSWWVTTAYGMKAFPRVNWLKKFNKQTNGQTLLRFQLNSTVLIPLGATSAFSVAAAA